MEGSGELDGVGEKLRGVVCCMGFEILLKHSAIQRLMPEIKQPPHPPKRAFFFLSLSLLLNSLRLFV